MRMQFRTLTKPTTIVHFFRPRLLLWAGLLATLSASIFTPLSFADKTNKTTITYIRFSETEGVVRVKPAGGIATPAPCQTQSYMVIPLSDPYLKYKLATLYTAAGTEKALVRLFGNSDCSNHPGAETITDIAIFPPFPN